jgi:hypothetical protein
VELTDRRRLHMRGAWCYTDLVELFKLARKLLQEGFEFIVELKPATRTLAQNALMWSILTDLSRQTKWAVDGEMVKLDPEDIKDILTASLRKHQRMVRGIDGGLVILGMRTSRMTKAQMSDVIEIGYMVGAQHGVRWSRTSLGREVPDEVVGEVIDGAVREAAEPKLLEEAHA